MGYTYIGDSRIKQIYIGNTRITKGYLGNKLIFSASNPVTYYIDVPNNLSVTREIDYGESVLDYIPTTPSNWDSSWKFLGWRTDKTASSSVLSSTTMGTEPIILYAVFKQDIVRHFISYDTTYQPQPVYGTRYYNNGNTVDATIQVPTGKLCEGWTWRGWSAGGTKSGDADVALDNGDVMENVTASGTHYGLYQRKITVTYDGNGYTGGNTAHKDMTILWSASGNYADNRITLPSCGFTKTAYTFSKWAKGNTSGTQYAANASVDVTASTTFYAIWTASASTYTICENRQLISWGSGGAEPDVTLGTIDLSGYSKISLGAYYQKGNSGLTPYLHLYVDNVKVLEGEDSDTSDFEATSPAVWEITSTYKKSCTIGLKAGNANNQNAVFATVQLIK